MSIDDLLSQPLPAVADNGFSARVASRIRAEQRGRMALVAAASAVAATAACFLLPMPAISTQFNEMVVTVLTSPAAGLGAAALVLTYLYDRRFFRI